MELTTIIRILNAHSVPYNVDNDRIYADSMEADTKVYEKLIDVTDWSRAQLAAWLGY